MTKGVESYVQVAQDSIGKKIRNTEFVVVKPDGSEHVVEAQVVILADHNGDLIDQNRVARLLTAILEQLEITNFYLKEMASFDGKHR